MIPLPLSTSPPARRRSRVAALIGPLVAAAALGLLVTGCGSAAATFDPSGPCVVDGQAPGSYPDLEARLPAYLDGAEPTTVDSGRSCTEDGLGSFVSHDLASVTFAGATWDLGDGQYASSVIFGGSGSELPAAWVAEFYEAGARTAKKTANIETSRPSFEGAGEAWRLDVLNDLSYQTVVTWQDAEVVRVVLVATPVAPDASRDDHDALVVAAVGASVAAPQAGG